MATNHPDEDTLSEGSDISDDLDDRQTDDPLDVAQQQPVIDPEVQAVLDIFDDNSDEDGDFFGFRVQEHDDWQLNNFTARNFIPYDGPEGSQRQFPAHAKPIDYFLRIWDNDMWQHLANETNRYAEQQRVMNPPPPSAPSWTPVDIDTMRAFIGLILCMGIIRLPCRNDYWRKSKWLFCTEFGKVISRDKFNLIWRYLHVHDNNQPIAGDKLWKMRWFIDFLNRKFLNIYMPKGIVSVDESMVKFKGRLGFRQYLPLKPTKWGIKIWNMCEADTGYMFHFQVYTGREAGAPQEHGLSYRVVMDLCRPILGTNMQVYMDNYYTSVELLQDLRERGVLACGTVRSNRRGLPRELLPQNLRLPKHEFRLAQKNELVYCVWMDTKNVLLLSNFHSPDDMGTVRRTQELRRQDVQVPKLLADYQKNMKGVDLCDQMVGYYQLEHRSRKWWRRLFFYLLCVSVHNAYILAKSANPDTRAEYPTFQDFFEDVALELVGHTRSLRQSPIVQRPARPIQVHTFQNNMYDKNRVCRECSLRAAPGERRGVTKRGCVQCGEPVHQNCEHFHIQRHNNA